jgi:hypothetical protein
MEGKKTGVLPRPFLRDDLDVSVKPSLEGSGSCSRLSLIPYFD